MAITIRELVAKIGFDVDDSGLIRAEKGIGSLQKTMLSITAVTTAAAAGVGFFLNEAGKMEQAKVAFEVLLGGADAANKKIQELTNFARKTPFTIPGILDSSRQLLAYGIQSDKLITTLKFLGDISLGDQEIFGRLAYAFGQVRAAGKLTGTELRQFTEARVGSGDLAKAMGIDPKDFSDKVSKGEISFEMLEKAMISITGEGGRFFNMMDKGSKTLFGLISNIKDTFTILSIEIGNEALPAVKKLSESLLKYLDVNKKIIKSNLLVFFRALITLLKFAFNIVYAVFRVFKVLSDVIGGTERAVKLLTFAFMSWMAINIAVSVGNMILSITALTASFGRLTISAIIAKAAVIAIPLEIAIAFAIVILILEDIVSYFKGENSVTGLITGKFKKMGEDIKAVFFDIHKTAFEKIMGISKMLRFIPGFGLVNSIGELSKSIPNELILKAAQGVSSILPFQGGPINPDFYRNNSNKNQSNTYNIKLDAPINVNGSGNIGSITKTIQSGLLGGMDAMLREAARQNTPVLEF